MSKYVPWTAHISSRFLALVTLFYLLYTVRILQVFARVLSLIMHDFQELELLRSVSAETDFP